MNVTSVGEGTIALIRCSGDVRTGGETKSWSAIVKVVEPGASNKFGGGDGSGVWTEINVYRGDIFATKAGPLRGGRCYLADEQDDGLYWLWIEDLSHLSGFDWTPNQYSLAASSIGQFRGRWLTEDLAALDWLPRNDVLNNLESQGVMLMGQKNFLAIKDDEYFRAGVPGDLYDRVIRLRENIPTFVRTGLTLPVTLAHCDCHIRQSVRLVRHCR